MFPRYEKIFKCLALLLALNFHLRLLAQDFLPSVSTAPDTGKPFIVAPATFISNAFYSIGHNSSSINLTPLNLSYGTADITLSVTINPWTARNSEGIFFAEYWIENQNPSGSRSIAGYSGIIPVNVNSGTQPSAPWNWTTDLSTVAYGSTFYVFGYCYMYNQGGGQQGEYALYSSLGSVCVPYPTAMQLPTSQSVNLELGQPFTASIQSSNPNTSFLYQILGQTSLETTTTAWAPLNAGSYSFQVGQVSDPLYYGNTNDPIWGNIELNPTLYTLTISPLNANQVTSINDITFVGSSWSPNFIGVNPLAGPPTFCVVNETNFGSSGIPTATWTPTKAGVYTFYVGQQIVNSNYNSSVIDPNLGAMVVNPTPYSITVQPLVQSVTSTDASITLGSSFTPTYITNNQLGSNCFQFCIINYTNFDGGNSLNQGTLDASSEWVTSWTPSIAGTYQFTVAEDANDQFSANNSGRIYSLTVTAIPSEEPIPINEPPSTVISIPLTTSNVTPKSNTTSQTTTVAAPILLNTTTPAAPITSVSASSNQQSSTLNQNGITRIRFNSLGHDVSTSFGLKSNCSYLWTDPNSITTDPWPTFSNPTQLTSNFGSINLPSPTLAIITHH